MHVGTVRLGYLYDLESTPFLRHCWNLQSFIYFGEMSTSDYPATTADSECDEPMDLRYLKALRTLSLCGSRAMLGYRTVSAFIRWLLSAFQLENLTVFEFPSDGHNLNEGFGGYSIDLN